MSTVAVRPFRRGDRDQLTRMINAHIGAVVPGFSVSVNTVMSQLEREPAEFIVDPWVAERVTLVAEHRGSLVAAAHLLRYDDAEDVGVYYRGLSEIRWLVHHLPGPGPDWPDGGEAAGAMGRAAMAQLTRWGGPVRGADGALPAPGVYGVPEQWPHIRELYRDLGFVHTGDTEVVLLARVEDLPSGTDDDHGWEIRRTMGINGVRLTAMSGEKAVGSIELDTDLAVAGLLSPHQGWADVGNLQLDHSDREGLSITLFAAASEWLKLARIDRLLHYASDTDQEALALAASVGFQVLTRTQRGWTTITRSTG